MLLQAPTGEGALERLLEAIDPASLDRRIIDTLVIILALVLLRWIILWIVRRNVEDQRSRWHWRRGTSYAVATIALFVVGRVWFDGVRSLATFLGLLAAGLALALKEPVQNFAGWIFIMTRRPFVLGDRIQVGAHAGDVVDERIFSFSLLEIGNWVDADQSTGRVIHVPNGKVFTEPIANYTRGFPYIWNELRVVVTFESDWRTAKALLLEIVERHASDVLATIEEDVRNSSRHYLIHHGTLTPTVYTSVEENGVGLTMRYLCKARARRGTAQTLWEEMLEAFAAHDDIRIAYPTIRYYDRPRELDGRTADRIAETRRST